MRTIAALLAVVALVGYCVWLVSNNIDPVAIQLGFASYEELALWQPLLGAFGLGVGGVLVGFAWPVLRMRLRVRTQGRRIRELEQELHGLRTLPLDQDDPAAKASAQES